MVTLKLLYERFKFSLTRLPVRSKQQETEIISALIDNGYYVLENFIDKEKCAEIRDEIDALISSDDSLTQWDNTKTDARILGAENLSKNIKEFHASNRLNNLSKIFYAEKSEHFFTMASRLEFNGINLGSGGGWHRDSFSPQFKAMLYLSDVDTDNGPFQYFPKSHRLSHMQLLNRFLKPKQLSKRYEENEINAFTSSHENEAEIELTGKAGTLLLFDSSGLHRGSPIRDASRYALTIYSMRKRSINAAKYKKFGITSY
tara:strand:+ start:136 stop:912 length:777 start_codon:yes stop_codon:yes gene_type:complete